MVFYIDDWRSKKEIEMDRSQYISNLISQQNKEIEQLKYKNKKLQETVDKLNEILKATDCEYGKYLQLKEQYKEL
jgi:flagellar biosynthesis chaperone FliJ